MAKAVQKKGVGRKPVPATLFRVRRTAQAHTLTPEEKKKNRDLVTKTVRAFGGKCQLIATPGEAFDFISIVTGISNKGMLDEIKKVIELGGNAKVVKQGGIHILKG